MKGLWVSLYFFILICLISFTGIGFIVGDSWGYHRSCKIKAEMSNDEFYVGE